MTDSNSGRDPKTNSGSDSAKHYRGETAHDAYHHTAKAGTTTPVTNRHPNGAVGVKADSAPMASGNVSPSDADAK